MYLTAFMTLFSHGKFRLYENITVLETKFLVILGSDCDQVNSSAFKILLLVCFQTDKK